jgi:hypothetical protein
VQVLKCLRELGSSAFDAGESSWVPGMLPLCKWHWALPILSAWKVLHYLHDHGIAGFSK